MNESEIPYAHNLVSSLYAIKGLVEAFLLNCEEGRAGNREEVLRRSEEILRRTHGQADQALQIAKRLGEVVSLGPEKKNGSSGSKVSVQTAWQNTVELLKKEYSLKALGILERIPENFPAISCDPDDFKEILYHLAKNSFQAMSGKGKLVIRAHYSFSQQEEPLASIQLADTGPGIPNSVLTRLFLPFSTTKNCSEGSGLGLFLTRQLVRRNHGCITVSSFEGFGTTFILEFPFLKSKR